MRPINQPTLNPTRKLTAATVGAALVSVAGLVLRNLAPDWYDAEVMMAVTPIVVFGLGYLIRDLPNTGGE